MGDECFECLLHWLHISISVKLHRQSLLLSIKSKTHVYTYTSLVHTHTLQENKGHKTIQQHKPNTNTDCRYFKKTNLWFCRSRSGSRHSHVWAAAGSWSPSELWLGTETEQPEERVKSLLRNDVELPRNLKFCQILDLCKTTFLKNAYFKDLLQMGK